MGSVLDEEKLNADEVWSLLDRIVHRVMKQHHRQKTRMRAREPLLSDAPLAAEGTKSRQDLFADSCDLAAEVTDNVYLEEILQHLTARQQTILRKLIEEQRSVQEVAMDLGMSRLSVYECLKRMRKTFQREWYT